MRWVFLILAGCTASDTNLFEGDGLFTPVVDTNTVLSPSDWVEIEALPCARTNSGDISCFQPVEIENPNRVLAEQSLKSIVQAEQGSPLLGLTRNGNVVPAVCPERLISAEAEGRTTVCRVPHEQLMESLFVWGGRTLAGEVLRGTELPAQTERWRVIGGSPFFVGLDFDDQIHISGAGYLSWGKVVDISFDGLPRSIIGFHMDYPQFGGERWFACVLSVYGKITCESEHLLAEVNFPNPPYQRLVQHWGSVCAQRSSDHVIECNDGRHYDFGPVRDFQIGDFGYIGEDGLEHSGENSFRENDFEISICAITTNNRIRCEGPYYDPEVLDALDALP